MSVLDCRGLACPQPLVTTKKALDQLNEGELIVIVDNATYSNNVECFAQSQGCSVEVDQRDRDFSVRIRKGKKRNVKNPSKAYADCIPIGFLINGEGKNASLS